MPSFGSVRARVTVGAVLVVAVALVAVGFVIVRMIAATMVDDAETFAEVQARNLAIVAEAGRLSAVLDVDAEGSTILQVTSSDGTVLAASHQLAGMGPLGASIPLEGRLDARTVRVLAPDGRATDFRVVSVGTESPSGQVVVSAGVSLGEAAHVLGTLTRLLVIALAVVLAVVSVVTWLVVARALRPVEAIRAEVEDLTSGDLSRRVPVPPHRDEVARLADTMNRMLARLEEASDRQRAFIADASHELRSPLASLRTQLEVTAAHPEGADVVEVAEESLEEVRRLETLTTDLLQLARLDAGNTARAESFDLAGLVADLLDQRRGDRVPVACQGAGVVPVQAATKQVAQVVTNLVDNAVRHAGSAVSVAVTRPDGPGAPVSVTVSDDGPGIPAADRERIFDRFVRLDATRSRDDGGTGLGLSIARELARANGGDVEVLDAGRGATLRLTIPAG
ncbi:Signal transduction histidine kinase [Tessaracoccus bendigoensis DSM 12906]|uniref:histidine kinase n=1 Tax=Tessaracoccus bendigoensis DSM 12906 TaxID=1123357 RepID=A0A1M6E2A1_9ACTN|nr:HAMP domain-containing sensor histidine kinase [Tessaracoccus bendigoensis]SHI79529.1 Signal transduction histidine kinase [Tessaracoccus bendigoensis DSM 12906]